MADGKIIGWMDDHPLWGILFCVLSCITFICSATALGAWLGGM
jgi:hypothetical protein